jgi:hypothetical protein
MPQTAILLNFLDFIAVIARIKLNGAVAGSKAGRNIFPRADAGIKFSNLTQGMDIGILSCFALLCVGSGLVMADVQSRTSKQLQD